MYPTGLVFLTQCKAAAHLKSEGSTTWGAGRCLADTVRPDSDKWRQGEMGYIGALWTPGMITSDAWVRAPSSIWGSQTSTLLNGSRLTEGSVLRKGVYFC